jgi:high-affinity K+ transport system ATPase subunit B
LLVGVGPVWYHGTTVKITRRTANLLLAMGLVMLLFWVTRAFTWYANDLQASVYLALVHLPIILISLAIGAYLAYLGVKGRRATRRSP